MTVSVKMMKVMRWPLRSLIYRKFHVTLILHGFEKLLAIDDSKFLVDVKWRGPKRSLGPRFRSIKRERSTEASATIDGVVEWEQEFDCECTLALSKESEFYPWDVNLLIRKITPNGSKPKVQILGSGNLNLGELAPISGNTRQRTKIPILLEETETALSVSLDFEELRSVQDSVETNHRIMAPAIPCISGNMLWDRDDFEEVGLKPFRSILTGLSSKTSRVEDVAIDGRTSDESSQDSPNRFESDSPDNFEDSDVVEEDDFSSFRYGTIAGANLFINNKVSKEDMLVFNGVNAVAVPRLMEEASSSDSDQVSSQSSMRRMLSWRKRKLSFRSPRARGEPLLNKAYGDNGGDEIDWDRRQSESPEQSLESMLRLSNDKSANDGTWDFGEAFQVGSWETKELMSRDGQLKLSASVFFASIDQRSESAAGESACTALVAVIADWLHRYSTFMPSRAEFDSLIREGSAEWRKLCQDATFKDRFPDRHFDLETVIEAAVRPLSVVPEKSFVGFFQPDGLGDSSDFLEGAMTFDSIWDEVERSGPAIYIVSWNDHFFVLKVDEHAVYIIDTLGERLYEGCDQAYLLKFDAEACLSYVPQQKASETQAQASAAVGETEKKEKKEAQQDGGAEIKQVCDKEDKQKELKEIAEKPSESEQEETAGLDSADTNKNRSYTGRSACREFVKGFFAAVPLRQLQSDLKKGLVGKDHLHRRLQIEFHFTESHHTQKFHTTQQHLTEQVHLKHLTEQVHLTQVSEAQESKVQVS